METKIVDEWKNECQRFLQTTLKNSGAKGYVIGLSGGIDSALAVCLAVDAVGKDKVLGVMMPCESLSHSLEDAQALARGLEIDFLVVDLFDTFIKLSESITKPTYNTIVGYEKDLDVKNLGNIKARLRMTTLYSLAGRYGYLVLGTSNLSELTVGYATKYGDGGVDIEPLGELYKSEVYEIAKTYPVIPENILTKSPSADLWEGQTDEQELGFTYDELETAIRLYKEHKPNSGNFIHNLPADKILRIQDMEEKNKHKRNEIETGPIPNGRYKMDWSI